MAGTKRSIAYLEGRFETGDVPTQQDFYDWLASYVHLDDQYFRGAYVSLAALQAAVPTGNEGDYAFVDAGVASDVQLYIWDNDDNDWILSGGGGIVPDATPSVKGIMKLYTGLGSNSDGTITQAAISALISGGFTNVAFVNSFAGVDFTGATDSKVGLQTAMASGAKVVVFDGLYRTTDVLTVNADQIVILRGGTVVELYGNVNTGTALFQLNDRSHIVGEPGSRLTHTPTGTPSYSGIGVATKYGWSIQGKMVIEKFGNQGIRVSGTPVAPNQYNNGIIKDVICRENINNGFGGAGGAGHGIKITTAEYVFILDVDCYLNAGYGISFDRAANCPINNCRIIKNTLGGLRLDGDYVANTDHFHVSNCQINHNDAVGTFNIILNNIDTGVNFNGCSVYGGNPLQIVNSRGVSFNGCGITQGSYSEINPGTQGDGIVRINGGHILYSTKAFKTTIRGGGSIILKDVMSTVIATSYLSNFSAGVDGWTASGTTNTGNVDGVGDGTTNRDDTLRVAGDAASSEHYAQKAALFTVGQRYQMSITIFIPTANTNADGLRIVDSGGYSYDVPLYDLPKNKWVTILHEFTALGTDLRVKALSAGAVSFTMPATDYVYIGRLLTFLL
jgi:hypothetical protein